MKTLRIGIRSIGFASLLALFFCLSQAVADPIKVTEADAPVAPVLLMSALGKGADAFKLALDQDPKGVAAAKDEKGRGLLHVAADNYQENEALLCLLAGADPNEPDASGKTPLFYAAAGKQHDRALVRDLLLLRGAKVNLQDNEGTSPLMFAIEQGADANTIEVLLWLGADLRPERVPAGRSPIALAAQRGDLQIIQMLRAVDLVPATSKRPMPKYIQRSFTEAARMGDLATLETLLAQGANINALDDEGKTALIRAINNQQETVVVFLLMSGANPNVADKGGMPPFGWTFGWFGLTSDYMRLALLAGGAKPDVTMPNGHSLLTYASARENEHAMQWLIWMGVDPNQAAPAGTPMRVASGKGNERAVALLKKNGVTETPFEDKRPEWRMAKAVKAGNTEEIQKMLDSGFPIDTVLDPNNGHNGMMMAINSRRHNVAQFLLDHGSDPNYQSPKNGETPLRITTCWLFAENEEFRERLLAAGADPNLPNHNGITPFIEACIYGDMAPKIAQMLLYGADMTIRDKKGMSALDHAAKSNRQDAANFLKTWGTKERREMLQQASNNIVGKWHDENSEITYLADGTKRALYKNGFRREDKWKVEGDLLIAFPSEGEKGPTSLYFILQTTSTTSQILSMKNGTIYNAKKIY